MNHRYLTGALAVAVVLSLTAQAATWDGNGDADNSGNWGAAANWDPDAVPGGGTDVVLPDVTAGTRTVTVDGARQYKTLTLNQATTGATNRLLLSGNLTTPCCGSGQTVTLNLTGGGIVLDKGSYDLIFGNSTSLSLPSGAILNSTGGRVGRNWNGGTPGHVTNNGTVNLTGGNTQFLHYGSGDIFTNAGTISLTGNGGLLITNDLFLNNGIVSGDGTGTINVPIARLSAGSQLSGVATITVKTFDLQSTDHTAVTLSATTLQSVNSNTPKTIEVGTNTAGRYLIDKFTVNTGGAANRTTLVDNYDNDLSSADPERLEVNTLQWAGSNFSELDLNGLDVTVSTAVALSPYQRQLSNRAAGSTSTVSLGGTVDLGTIMNNDFNGGLSLLVHNGATLEIAQTAALSYVNVEAGNGTIRLPSSASSASGGGIHAYSPNGNAWAPTDVLTVDVAGGAGTLTLLSTAGGAYIEVENAATLIIDGSVENDAAGNSTRGTIVGPASKLTITGDYTDSGGRLEIGSAGILTLGGDYDPVGVWNGWSNTVSHRFDVDTTANPARLIFNGGGPVQSFETMSNLADVDVGNDLLKINNDWVTQPFGSVEIGAVGGAVANVQLANNRGTNFYGPPGGVNDTAKQVARDLDVNAGSSLDLNGLDMIVALGEAVVDGTILDNAASWTGGDGDGDLTLQAGAGLTLGADGLVDIAGTLAAGDGSLIDLSQGSIYAGALDLTGSAVLDLGCVVAGRLRVDGDVTAQLSAYITSGAIVGSAQPFPLVAQYVADGDYTTVTKVCDCAPLLAAVPALLCTDFLENGVPTSLDEIEARIRSLAEPLLATYGLTCCPACVDAAVAALLGP